jgi:hypothetical protein
MPPSPSTARVPRSSWRSSMPKMAARTATRSAVIRCPVARCFDSAGACRPWTARARAARARYITPMKLAEKGRFAPPPALPLNAQAVSEVIAAWPSVHARTHWLLGDEREVDGADFYVGQEEIGHIHLDGEAHIAVSKRLRAALLEAGLAKPFRWNQKFVLFRIETAKDRGRAEALFRLAYQSVRGAPDAQLLKTLATSGPGAEL